MTTMTTTELVWTLFPMIMLGACCLSALLGIVGARVAWYLSYELSLYLRKAKIRHEYLLHFRKLPGQPCETFDT